jgi:hypothetical protein
VQATLPRSSSAALSRTLSARAIIGATNSTNKPAKMATRKCVVTNPAPLVFKSMNSHRWPYRGVMADLRQVVKGLPPGLRPLGLIGGLG